MMSLLNRRCGLLLWVLISIAAVWRPVCAEEPALIPLPSAEVNSNQPRLVVQTGADRVNLRLLTDDTPDAQAPQLELWATALSRDAAPCDQVLGL